MGKRIVIALGGNALGNTLPEQMAAVKKTAKAVADLIEEGHEIILSHGNGPQVGMINVAMGEMHKADPEMSVIPMSVCVAMSQGYIGYDLQNSLREELLDRGINKPVVTIISQVRVDEHDEAFDHPTKPIGRFMTKEEADEVVKNGYKVAEDSGRGYRRVVASPKPVEIMELDTVRALTEAGQVVIAAGGGGIPVVNSEGNHLRGVGAVIDKDFSAALLARDVGADTLIILTAVEKVAVNFGKPDERWLDRITVDEARNLAGEGEFGKGSMEPKVLAAAEFASSKKGREALITLLSKAKDGIEGRTGTIISD